MSKPFSRLLLLFFPTHDTLLFHGELATMKLPRLVLALQCLRVVAALADTPVEDEDEIIPGAYIVEFDTPQVSTSISVACPGG